MSFEDNHNHFCIYCGAKLLSNQHFCSHCGKKVFRNDALETHSLSKYDDDIVGFENDYNLKQIKASQLVEMFFSHSDIAYEKFTTTIKKSNQIFNNQLNVVKKMAELDIDGNELIENEIENKFKILQSIIDKMEDLINELVINLNSNKKDNDDVDILFKDMDELINSVKDY